MKTAIYIESGRTQFVLTAESDIDKKVLEQLATAKGLQTFQGSFYDCSGGWIRQSHNFNGYNHYGDNRDDSLILLVEEKKDDPSVLCQLCNEPAHVTGLPCSAVDFQAKKKNHRFGFDDLGGIPTCSCGWKDESIKTDATKAFYRWCDHWDEV